MASDQSAATKLSDSPQIAPRPDELRDPYLPLAMRGYDRREVDRYIARAADAYELLTKQGETLRQRLRSRETELRAALDEAEASARTVAGLMQSATTNPQPPATSDKLNELEARLASTESEREKALADLQQMSEHASNLSFRLEELEAERQALLSQRANAVTRPLADDEAARLLVAAARAAEDLRDASRDRALRTLKKARELAALASAEIERERAHLSVIEGRRAQAERDAEEILASARTEVDRAAAEIEERRSRADREAEEILATARAQADSAAAAHADTERGAAEIEERRSQVEREAEEILAEARVQAHEAAAEGEERRRQAEREAEQLLGRARAEADQSAITIEEERDRVRGLLAGALASLGAETAALPSTLAMDLQSRLNEDTEPSVS